MSWMDVHRAFHFAVLAVVLAAGLAGAGCRSNPNRDLQTDPDRAYEIAKRRLDNGDYQRAIQMYEQLVRAFEVDIDWAGLQQSVGTGTRFYRLEVTGRIGNMTRHLFAVLKLDGAIVRTVYYRED